MTIEENKLRARKLIIELLSVPNEKREEEITEELDKLCPDPSYSDYLFWSKKHEQPNGELDIDAVIDKVFSYKAIQL